MNLDTTHEHSEWFKETGHFKKKENNSNIKEIKCYTCDIKEHYMWDYCKLRKSQTLAAIK